MWTAIGLMLGLAATPQAATPQPSGLVPPPRVLACEDRVEGPKDWPPPRWRRDAVHIGPVSFFNLRTYEDAQPAGEPGAETVALVRADHQVTIRVRDVTLAWPQVEHRQALTFLACPHTTKLWSRPGRVGRRTQFNGGFHVTKPTCARIDVWVNQRRRPLRRYLAFGRDCPARRPPEPPPTDTATGLVPPPPVLSCGARVETGRGFPPPGWRRRSLSAGPFTLYNLRENARLSAGGAETVAILKANRQVTLSIPPPNRRQMDLLFAAGPGSAEAITFKACPPTTRRFSPDHRTIGRFTLFQGGISAPAKSCAPLDFWVEPRRHPIRHHTGFGRPC